MKTKTVITICLTISCITILLLSICLVIYFFRMSSAGIDPESYLMKPRYLNIYSYKSAKFIRITDKEVINSLSNCMDNFLFLMARSIDEESLNKKFLLARIDYPCDARDRECFTLIFVYSDGSVGFIENLASGMCLYYMPDYVDAVKSICEKYGLQIEPVSYEKAEEPN